MRQLILLGSGETSPSMVTFHQQTLRSSHSPAFMDTSYGFQVNADDLSDKFSSYFKDSVGRELTAISLRSENAGALEIATARNQLLQCDYLIAGPGSPTYALNVWTAHEVRDDFLSLLQRGTLVLSSAAALSAGAFTIPVYEIYKVGQSPVWRAGLDLVGALFGLSVAVVPHFNNAEGGRHDTRACYIGVQRLELLEAQLPAGAVVLGIDEHSGVQFDLETGTLSVFGSGGLTIRRNGNSEFLPAGAELSVAEIGSQTSARPTPAPIMAAVRSANELLQNGEVKAAIAVAVEDLDIDRLHAFIVQLGDAALNTKRTDLPETYIDSLVELRSALRSEKRWHDSDVIRDFLLQLGIEISDSSSGSSWSKSSS